MCLHEENAFNPTFTPSPKHVNFMKGMIVLSREHHPGNEQEFAVYAGWIAKKLPSPASNLDALMEAGYVLCISEQWDDAVTYALTDGAVEWCEQNGIIPAISPEERMGSYDWIEAIVYTGKVQRTPGLTRKGHKNPTARRTSPTVKYLSYTPGEAAAARAEIEEMRVMGIITERTAAGYKATVTRRIAA